MVDGNRLVEQLARGLRDPRVAQVDVVVAPPQDRPTPFCIEDRCLGIPLDAIPAVLAAAWAQLRQCARSVAAGDQTLRAAAPDVSQATLCILTLNPDHHTAWNWRKRLLGHGHLVASEELGLLSLLATYKRGCKSGLLWHHRRWVVSNFALVRSRPGLAAAPVAAPMLLSVWDSEAKACSQGCERYPRNYHCWAYRWWCYTKARTLLVAAHPDSVSALDRDELGFAQTWIRTHPADYAAMHYFHLLADLVDRDASESCPDASAMPSRVHAIALSELSQTSHSLESLFTCYESVWYHRRWCLVALARHGAAHLADSEHTFLDELQHRHSNNAAVAGHVAGHRAWISRELPATQCSGGLPSAG